MKTRRSYKFMLLGLVLVVGGLCAFSGCKKRPTSVTPPTSQTPTSETPTSETPTSETPTSQTPTSQTPTSQTPTSETPTSDTPSVEHKAVSEWSHDNTHHWHACVATGCTEVFDKEAHTFDKKVSTAEYLASEANCTAPKTYYYSCVCGAKGTNTYTEGEPNGNHDYKVTYDTNYSYHYYTCEHCGEIKDVGLHQFSEVHMIREATETTGGFYGKVCEVCGCELGQETLPLSKIPDVTNLGKIFELTDNGDISYEKPDGLYIYNYYVAHAYTELEGGYYIEDFYFVTDRGNFYLNHVTDPSSPIYGYGFYRANNKYERTPLTEEQYNSITSYYNNWDGDILDENGDYGIDKGNESIVKALYGDDAYYYDIYAIETPDGIDVYVNLSSEENGLSRVSYIISYRNGKVWEFRREILYPNETDFDWILSVHRGNIKDNYVETMPRGDYLVSASVKTIYTITTSPIVRTAVDDYFDSIEIKEADTIDMEAVLALIDSAKYEVVGYGYVTDDFYSVPLGEDIVVPYEPFLDEIGIYLEIERKTGTSIDIQVSYADQTYPLEFDIEINDVRYDEIKYSLKDVIKAEVPAGYAIVGFNTSATATEELAADYIVQDGDVFYPIIKPISKFLLASGIDGKYINGMFADPDLIDRYLVNEIMVEQDEKLYYIISLNEYDFDVKTDFGDRDYHAVGLYTSRDCAEANEVEQIVLGGKTYYCFPLVDTVYYVKYECEYYIISPDNNRYMSVEEFKGKVATDGFEAAYAVLKAKVEWHISSYYETDLFIDEDLTIPFTADVIDTDKDIIIYPKITYPSDNYLITIDDSKYDIPNNVYVLYDFKDDFSSDVQEAIEHYIYHLSSYDYYIEGLYLDPECTIPWTEWPESDLTVYPKINDKIITIVEFNSAKPWEICRYEIDELLEEYMYDLMSWTYKRHLSLKDWITFTVGSHLNMASMIEEGYVFEELYYDAAFTKPWDGELVAGMNLYMNIVPEVYITFDQTQYQLSDSSYSWVESAYWHSEARVYKNFEYFVDYLRYMLSQEYALPADFEIAGFYLDPECTIPFTDYPTTDVTLYPAIQPLQTLSFDNSHGKLKGGVGAEPLLTFLADYEVRLLDINNVLGEAYELEANEEIDYVYYLDGDQEVVLTTWPTESLTIMVKFREIVMITFDYSNAEPMVPAVSARMVSMFKGQLGLAEFCEYMLENGFYLCVDGYVVEGLYLDPEFTIPWTEIPNQSITIYAKVVPVE